MAHSRTEYQHQLTMPNLVSGTLAIRPVDTTSSRLASMLTLEWLYPPSSTRPSKGRLLAHLSSSRSRISKMLSSQARRFLLFYSMCLQRFILGSFLTLSSAKQPLVRAPNAIREPALMRKLAAAGAQATLSPIRKPMSGKENAEAGPSRGRRRMEPVGEEEEEPEEEQAAVPRTQPSDTPDEALYQKARVVTGNAAQFGRERDTADNVEHMAPGPEEQHFGHPPRKSSVHPQPSRKSVAASPPRKAMAPTRVVSATAPPRESKQAKQRPSLFEIVAKNLTDAHHMAQTPGGFYAPGKSSTRYCSSPD